MGYNKRLGIWLAAVTLAVVIGCLAAEWYIEAESDKMLADLRPLAGYVAAADWENAEQGLGRAVEHWQGARRVWLGLLSHAEVWNIDEALISLSVFMDEQKSEDAKNQLSLVEYYLERSRESDDINWHNFF